MTPEVAAAFDAMPSGARTRALELRELVFETATHAGLPPPTETLKWGEPAYLPGRSGTTVRIGRHSRDAGCKLLVHCQTRLVENWRARFEDRLSFEGNRAVLVDGTAPLDRAALSACIVDAFTYHRRG